MTEMQTNCILIFNHLSISDSSRDIKRVPNFTLRLKILTQTSPSFWVKIHGLFIIDRGGGSLIVCDGGGSRCEVSLQSYSPSNVELGLGNANF